MGNGKLQCDFLDTSRLRALTHEADCFSLDYGVYRTLCYVHFKKNIISKRTPKAPLKREEFTPPRAPNTHTHKHVKHQNHVHVTVERTPECLPSSLFIVLSLSETSGGRYQSVFFLPSFPCNFVMCSCYWARYCYRCRHLLPLPPHGPGRRRPQTAAAATARHAAALRPAVAEIHPATS